ncbi:uncharacterized protein DS421_14g456450 [Arachis hypogaea]|nr:uncharacterized protein DS421_14g456450 [Arachis hypogaea]
MNPSLQFSVFTQPPLSSLHPPALHSPLALSSHASSLHLELPAQPPSSHCSRRKFLEPAWRFAQPFPSRSHPWKSQPPPPLLAVATVFLPVPALFYPSTPVTVPVAASSAFFPVFH